MSIRAVERKIIVEVDPGLRDLIPSLLVHRRAEARAILDAAEVKDFETMFRLGCRLWGDGGTCGLSVMAELGRKIKDAGNEYDSAAVSRAAWELLDYFERVERSNPLGQPVVEGLEAERGPRWLIGNGSLAGFAWRPEPWRGGFRNAMLMSQAQRAIPSVKRRDRSRRPGDAKCGDEPLVTIRNGQAGDRSGVFAVAGFAGAAQDAAGSCGEFAESLEPGVNPPTAAGSDASQVDRSMLD